MTLQRKVHHHIDACIPPQQIRHPFALVYDHNADEVGRATIKGCNVAEHLNENNLIELGSATTQANPYAQPSQSLREWSQQDSSDIYTTVIHVDKLPKIEHGERDKVPESSEVVAIFMKVLDVQVDTRDILLCKRIAVNLNANHVLDKIPIDDRSYDALRYVLSLPDRRKG